MVFMATNSSLIEEELQFVHVLGDPVAHNEDDGKILATFPCILWLDII